MNDKKLDKEWAKLSDHWKKLALDFIEHEKFIKATRKKVKALKEKMRKDKLQKCTQ